MEYGSDKERLPTEAEDLGISNVTNNVIV